LARSSVWVFPAIASFSLLHLLETRNVKLATFLVPGTFVPFREHGYNFVLQC
jgi:hypothetical protein